VSNGGAGRTGRVESPVAWRVSADGIKGRGYNLDIRNPHTVDDDPGDPAELLEQLDAAEAEVARVKAQLKQMLAEALLR